MSNGFAATGSPQLRGVGALSEENAFYMTAEKLIRGC